MSQVPPDQAYPSNPTGSALAAALAATSATSVRAVLRLDDDASFELSVYKGDWESAKKFIKHDPGVLTARISQHSRTALHVAACGGHWQFMEKLVELMPPEALAMQDTTGYTAIQYAAIGGSTKAAMALVRKNRALPHIADNNGWTPLLAAAVCAPEDKDLVWYLSLVTTDDPPSYPFTGPLAGQLTRALALAGFHVVPVEFNYTPPHSVIGNKGGSLENLQGLAEMPTSTQPKTCLARVLECPKRLLWKAILLAPGIKQVRDAKLRHKCALELVKRICISLSPMNDTQIYEFFLNSATVTTAASYGIVEIVRVSLQMIPDLIWLPVNRPLLQVAVEHRREKIFNLTYDMAVRNKIISPMLIDMYNSILHLAAKLAPPPQLKSVSGAALQMQRELQWFKEVEKLMHPTLKELPNMYGKTAREVFTDEHIYLVEKGEKWMKDTSNSCMVVTTLIATVMFAAAFTVPGGNNSDTGIPIFLKSNSFMLFAISDALALIFSSTSLLMFLSILTARYAEEDFLKSLPKRLILGLAFLFLAILTMMIAFGATLSIVLHQKLKWIAIPVTLLASLPTTIFAILQLPLFVQMLQSTYGSGVFRHEKVW